MLNLGAVWGLDIGDSALKAVKLKMVGKQIALLDYQIVRYSEISGEAGSRREGFLTQALTALQSAGLGRDKCVVSIPPQSVFSRFISLPPVDKRRIPEIVLYEARQQIPFNLNEVVWSYETVRKEFVPGEEIEIGLFAVKREVINGYLAELAPVWKKLQGVQVGPLGLYNFIRHEIPLDQPKVVMDIGAQSTNLLIIEGDKFWLRNLPIAGNSFTSVLEKRLNIPRAEAEKLKFGIEESRHRKKLLEVLRPIMRDLVAEVQRSVGYYKSLSQAVKLEEIIVTGEGYKLFGLDRFLGEQLQYQVTPVHQLKNIVYQGDPARMQALSTALPSLGPAIGLALQGLAQSRVTLNLLPEDFIIRRELHKKRFTGFIAAALVWGIVGSLYVRENRTVQAMEDIATKGERTLQDVQRLADELKRAEEGDDPVRLKQFEQFGKYREYQVRVIGEISNVIPREVRVEGFMFSGQALQFEPAPAMAASSTSAPAAPPVPGVPGSSYGPPEMFGGGMGMPGMGMPGMEMFGGGMGMPGMGMPGMPGATEAEEGSDEQKVASAKLLLTFRVLVENEEEQYITERLKEQLKKARIFPERLELVKGVVIQNVQVTEPARATDTGGLPSGLPRMPGGGNAPVERSRANWTLTAVVNLGLLAPDEVDEKLEDARKEAEKKAVEPAPDATTPPATPANPAPAAAPAGPGT